MSNQKKYKGSKRKYNFDQKELTKLRDIIVSRKLYTRKKYQAYQKKNKFSIPSPTTIYQNLLENNWKELYELLRIKRPTLKRYTKQYFIAQYIAYEQISSNNKTLQDFSKKMKISPKGIYKHFESFEDLKQAAKS